MFPSLEWLQSTFPSPACGRNLSSHHVADISLSWLWPCLASAPLCKQKQSVSSSYFTSNCLLILSMCWAIYYQQIDVKINQQIVLCIAFNKYFSIDWSLIQWSFFSTRPQFHDLPSSIGFLTSFPSKFFFPCCRTLVFEAK